MIIDLTCPIEITQYEIFYDDYGSAEAMIDLFNLSDSVITGYDITVVSEKGGKQKHQNFSVGEIRIEGGYDFKLKIPLKQKKANELYIIIQKVFFEDGTSWQSKNGALVDTCTIKILQGNKLNRLRELAGEDAIAYPETQDKFWRCVCGRINMLSDDKCYRCHRELTYVLKDLNSKISSMDNSEIKRREKRARKAENSRARMEGQKKYYIYIALLLAAIAAFLMLVCAVALTYSPY